ncbi:hypothetical protein [Prevotella sp.]|uniref:hypothetical protein n=1 Tax=Prevotella sp. TaxID=59823 RepID=UPI002A7FCD2E|nr:hypothetical protein [Prevotella sp.]MDY4644658.1 hypothetical protein [Prevotella sp.]
MNIIFSILLVFFIILLLAISSAWLESYQQKHKVKFAETIIDKVSSLIDSKLESVTGQSEGGPWYLVVYTQDSNYPIWISNNNIRSVHPDPANNKIIVKQFCNEDMVIENVVNYELCSGSDMCDYDM